MKRSGKPLPHASSSSLFSPIKKVYLPILLRGSEGVGAQSLMSVTTSGKMRGSSAPSVSVAQVNLDFTLQSQPYQVKCELLTLPVTEKHPSNLHYSKADQMGFVGIVIVLYDVCDDKTFKTAKETLACLNSYPGKSERLILVGNKADSHDRYISTREGVALAKEQKVDYFYECSLKYQQAVRIPLDMNEEFSYSDTTLPTVREEDDQEYHNPQQFSVGSIRDMLTCVAQDWQESRLIKERVQNSGRNGRSNSTQPVDPSASRCLIS